MPDVSYALQGSPADVAFNAFSSLGAIFLLFGLTVLLEIQVRVLWARAMTPVHETLRPWRRAAGWAGGLVGNGGRFRAGWWLKAPSGGACHLDRAPNAAEEGLL